MNDEEIEKKALEFWKSYRETNDSVRPLIKETIRLAKHSFSENPEEYHKHGLIGWEEVADKLQKLVPNAQMGGNIDDILESAVEQCERNAKENMAGRIFGKIDKEFMAEEDDMLDIGDVFIDNKDYKRLKEEFGVDPK